MSSNSPTTAPRRSRRPLWLWLVLAAVAIIVLILALTQCGAGARNAGDDAGNDAGAAPSATSAPAAAGGSAAATPAPNGGGAAGGAAGTFTAGSTALLPLSGSAGAGGELTGLVDNPVTAQAVAVQSVPSDEGFWVGDSDTDRVWVQLTQVPGESPFQVEVGDRVDFTGTVVAHDGGFAQQIGVDAAEGADQLTQQAAHVEVAQPELALTQ